MDISDHCPTFLCINKNTIEAEQTKIYFRVSKQEYILKFFTIQSSNWLCVWGGTGGLNAKLSYFVCILDQ